ncbi:MAG: serine protease [Candidatus Paceibacterota bacterium]|jgi:hypothetical protein
MRLEDLTHSQIILLTALVSFVTAIATGILTTSLLNSADSQNVSRSINQVVERTIEKVVPQTIIQTVTKEVSVPTNEGEKIVTAINAASPTVFKIYAYKYDGTYQALDSSIVLIDKKIVVTTAKGIDRNNNYVLKLDKDQKINLNLAVLDSARDLAIFKLVGDFSTLTKNIPALSFAKASVIGQTVVGLGSSEGADNNPLSVGILLSAGSNNASSTNPSFFKTNAANADTLGGPVLNISGELVGLVVRTGVVLSINDIGVLIDSIK